MAWLSSGTSNEDLVNQLVHNGVIKSIPIKNAFQFTDRGDFIQPQELRAQAYQDRPFKNRHIHISAPHMYATILEALELTSGLAFLNVGSGSGYLSCLAACLLGDNGLSHGIEVSSPAITHSQECTKKWFEALLTRRKNGEEDVPLITEEGVAFVCGNCFNIDIEQAGSSCRYDRIYIGAGCPESRKEFFFSLLADDGILVASINETSELVKIRRAHRQVYSESSISRVNFAPLVEPEPSDETYEMRPTSRERLNSFTSTGGSVASSGRTSDDSSSTFGLSSSPGPVLVNFSSSPGIASLLRTLKPLPHRSRKKVLLPPLLWSPTPSRHRQFSRCFKASVFEILLIARFPRYQTGTRELGSLTVLTSKICPCSRVPHILWMLILTYTTRDWFVPTPTITQQICDELVVEKTLRQAAEQRATDECLKRKQVERERDALKVYSMYICKYVY